MYNLGAFAGLACHVPMPVSAYPDPAYDTVIRTCQLYKKRSVARLVRDWQPALNC